MMRDIAARPEETDGRYSDTETVMSLMASQKDRFYEENEEVYYLLDRPLLITLELLHLVKEQAARTRRKRCRICLHTSPQDEMHEMLIAHHRDCYVRPHAHLSRDESLLVLEGMADLLLFEESGPVQERIPLASERLADTALGARIPAGIVHSLIIRSEWLVFVETIRGPLDRNQTRFPIWSAE